MENTESKTFSFEPQTLEFNDQGQQVVVDDMYMVALGAFGLKTIYYTPTTNQYWTAPGKLVNQERFERDYLPNLSWDYDQIETVKDKKVNKFPCSPENIELKRNELMATANKSKKDFYENILIATSPRTLKSPFENKLNNASADDRMITRLNASRF